MHKPAAAPGGGATPTGEGPQDAKSTTKTPGLYSLHAKSTTKTPGLYSQERETNVNSV